MAPHSAELRPHEIAARLTSFELAADHYAVMARSARLCPCWWHRLTISTYDTQRAAWEARAELVARGYSAEMLDHRRVDRPPTFRAVLEALSQNADPASVQT